MKKFLSFIRSQSIALIGIACAVLLGGAVVHPSFGAFNPTGGTTYYLQSSLSATQTTITLTSFYEPVSNIPYTMSYLNTDIVYATINPETTRSEFVSFTGITQNGNGTATLTGVSRGLERSYPFVASSTLSLAFPGQTKLILSSPPQFFNEYAAKRNAQTVSGIWNFTALPTSNVACTGATQFCNKAYIDSGLNQGAATSTETNIGLVELATNSEIAAGTASSSATGPLVPPNKYFHSAQASCNSIACVPVAVSGKISQLFLDLTQSFSVSGAWAFTSTVNIAANVANHFTLNGVSYVFPGASPATSTALQNDGNNNLFWGPAHSNYSAFNLTGNTVSNAYGTTTLLSIPSGILNASSTIDVSGYTVCGATGGSGGTCTVYIRDGNGNTFGTFSYNSRPGTANGQDPQGPFSFVIQGNGSVSSQQTTYSCASVGTYNGGSVALVGCFSGGNAGTSAINLSNATTFTIVTRSADSNETAITSGISIRVHQ